MRYTLDEDAAVVAEDGTRDALLSGTEVFLADPEKTLRIDAIRFLIARDALIEYQRGTDDVYQDQLERDLFDAEQRLRDSLGVPRRLT